MAYSRKWANLSLATKRRSGPVRFGIEETVMIAAAYKMAGK